MDELKFLEYVFEKYNKCSTWVPKQLLSENQSENSNIRNSMQENHNYINEAAHLLALTYAGPKGEKLIKSMKNSLTCALPETVTSRVTYSGTRLSSKFTKRKDKTVKEGQHDIVYYIKCPESQCSVDYTIRRLSERVLDHNGRNTKSHLVKKCHKYPKLEDFRMIDKSYGNNAFKQNNHFHNILRLFDVFTWCIYQLSHEFPNELRLRKYQESLKNP